jgi:hypothetical protein
MPVEVSNMADSRYQPPEGYTSMAQAAETLHVSLPTLRRMAQEAGAEVFEDPRDRRVRLLRVEDVERLAQPVKKVA